MLIALFLKHQSKQEQGVNDFIALTLIYNKFRLRLTLACPAEPRERLEALVRRF